MSSDVTEEEKNALTPESGFNLCGIDYFESVGRRLYLIEHYEKYQDALKAKKERDRQDEYLILYHGIS
jgi:squalene cyclase